MAASIVGTIFLVSAILTRSIGSADDFKTALAKQQTKENFKNFLTLDGTSGSNRLQIPNLQPQLTSEQWRAWIERLLEVRCSSREMTIVLQYSYRRLAPKPVEDALKNARMSTESHGSTVGACASLESRMVKEDDDALILTVGYDHCGVRRGEESNDTVTYSVTVVVEVNISSSQGDEQRPEGIRQAYLVQCVHPISREVDERPAFTFALANDKLSGEAWTYPHTMNASRYVYLSSNVTLSWQARQEVYAYPIDCWSSPASSRAARPPRRYFMRNGCAERANIHHFTNGPTKVSVQGSALLFEDTGEEPTAADLATKPSERAQNLVLSCDLIPCTHSSTMGLLNIPKCPPSYFCSGKPVVGSNVLPQRLRAVKRTNVAAGPVTVREVKQEEVTATTVDCRLACRKPQPQPTVSQVPPTEAVTPDRVSKWTAAFIAVASFVFGIMFMAAMLWIHVKTDPKRLKHLQEQYNRPSDRSMTIRMSIQMDTAAVTPRHHSSSRQHDSGCHSDGDGSSSSTNTREMAVPFLPMATSQKSRLDMDMDGGVKA